jgi:hypothetical protein
MSLYHPIHSTPYTTIAPADDILIDNPTEQYTNNSSYAKLKEIRIFYRGKIRTYFELRAQSSSYAVYGCVYRNGAAVGSARSTTSTTYVSFTEDIDGWFEGDYYQIYGMTTNTSSVCYVQNQQVRGVLTTQKPVGVARL